MLSQLQDNVWFFLLAAGLLGLAAGSFLNVVIHRLPIMMRRAWRRECQEWLNSKDGHIDTAAEERYNLLVPRSHCPNCGHRIGVLENIPIISFTALGGRCAKCHTPISRRYPLIEALTALLSIAVAWRFGFAWVTAAVLLFTWALIALAAIDLETKLLPDSITLPALWLGVLLNMGGVFTDLQSSVLGAIFGYLSLWFVYHVFKLLTGKEGMGFGDFKLLAMLGAWAGWQALPLIILLSSALGALVGVSLILLLGRDRNIPIPFGPYLAVAGWIALLWGAPITDWYLRHAT
ncbi:MAG: prepilin peptidase [Gammaproteobacteria bacterium]